LSDKRDSYVVLTSGVSIALVSILIDPLRGYDIHITTVQTVGLIVGIIVALIGDTECPRTVKKHH
jgi:hypothetical protein